MAQNLSWKTISLHILILLFFLVYETLVVVSINPSVSLVKYVIVYTWYIAFFYFVRYVFLPFWNEKKKKSVWTLLLPAVLVGYGFSIIYLGQICNRLIGLPIVPITGLIIRVSLFRSGYIMGLALLFFYQSLAIQKEKMIRIREQEYDRSRINQHLVFNTLGFMYEALEIHYPQVARTALDLSDILSYSLQQSGSTGKVPVIDEVEQMHRYIRVNQQLYDNKLQVDFSANLHGDAREILIPSLLLVNLLENMFKHGDLTEPSFPGLVRLRVTGELIYFRMENRKQAGPKPTSTGFGLDNARQRLTQAYGDRFNLHTNDVNNRFSLTLIIDL